MSATYKLMMLRRYRLVRALLALSCLFCTVNAAPALHPNEGFRVLTANSIYIFSVNSNKTRSHIFETLYSLVLIYAVEALKDITKTLGVKYLDLSEDPCFTKTLVITKVFSWKVKTAQSDVTVVLTTTELVTSLTCNVSFSGFCLYNFYPFCHQN